MWKGGRRVEREHESSNQHERERAEVREERERGASGARGHGQAPARGCAASSGPRASRGLGLGLGSGLGLGLVRVRVSACALLDVPVEHQEKQPEKPSSEPAAAGWLGVASPLAARWRGEQQPSQDRYDPSIVKNCRLELLRRRLQPPRRSRELVVEHDGPSHSNASLRRSFMISCSTYAISRPTAQSF